jgi:methyl-accepting chemotaxis protein
MWQFKRAGIVVRMLIPVISLFLLGVGVLFFYIWDRATQNAVDSSVVAAKATIGQYKTLRQYYTENVVAKAVGEGGMKAAYNHKGVSKTLPLPATMIHDLSSLMEADGGSVRLRLYSEYPFPNRKGRVLDSFAREALAAIQKDPSQAFVKTEGSGNKTVVRVAIADRLVNQTCVNCHNARPDSPKTNWRLGDVRGALEVSTALDSQMAMNRSMLAMVGVICLLVVAIVSGFIVLFVRSLVKPIRGVMERLDETSTQTELESDQISKAAQSLAAGSSKQAAALEQTSATMEEISSMVRNNCSSAEQAVQEMNRANQSIKASNRSLEDVTRSMREVTDATAEVSKIIHTIDGIAFQTNVLALNAAVEAARAGEAGLGFAVVADEVRSLAQRTTNAARETATLIEKSVGRVKGSVQNVESCSTSVSAITGSAEKLKRILDQVGAGSRQQTEGVEQISKAIAEIDGVIQQTASRAQESAAASEELKRQAEQVRSLVDELRDLVDGR